MKLEISIGDSVLILLNEGDSIDETNEIRKILSQQILIEIA